MRSDMPSSRLLLLSLQQRLIYLSCYRDRVDFPLSLPYHTRPSLCCAGFTAGLCKGLLRSLSRALYHAKPRSSRPDSFALLLVRWLCFCTPCLALSCVYVYNGSLASRASIAACIQAAVCAHMRKKTCATSA